MLFLAMDSQTQARGLMLLMCIVALGVLGIAMIAGLAIARQRHWNRLREDQKEHRKQHQQQPQVDPWEEAGRRMEVPDLLETGSKGDDGKPL